jgi:transporter family protein
VIPPPCCALFQARREILKKREENIVNHFVFAVITMLCWGIAPLFGKAGLTNTDPAIAMVIRSIIIAVILLAWLVFSGNTPNFLTVEPKTWGLIAVEGIFASLLGHLAYFYALKLGSASTVTPITSAAPMVTVLLAVILLGERFSWYKLLGALLVVIGITLIKR